MHNAESARITDSAKRWHGYEQIVQIWATVSLYVLHVDIVQIGGDVRIRRLVARIQAVTAISGVGRSRRRL
jgi:hypothetical protein